MAPTTESQQFLNNDDLQQILSDALASFSPLAALVGAESARSLSQHVTNMKQTFVASIAPIGALGMMASLVKGMCVHVDRKYYRFINMSYRRELTRT